jgi:hypothetical protein
LISGSGQINKTFSTVSRRSIDFQSRAGHAIHSTSVIRRARKSPNKRETRITRSGVRKRVDLDEKDVAGWWGRVNAPWDVGDDEDVAANPTGAAPGRWRKVMLVIVFVSAPILLLVGAAMVFNAVVSSKGVNLTDVVSQGSDSEALEGSILSAEKVARAFLNESDSQKRLQWVRNGKEVAKHLGRYAEEALSHEPVQLERRGQQVDDDAGLEKTGFAARFASGSFRLLNVVATPEGQRVDWDSYARYCSASWEHLLSGKESSAEVRVFVSPGDYHNGPFSNAAEWTCFRLMSPDLPEGRDVFAYAAIGSSRETQLRRIVLRAAQFRQHMTLQIESREAPGGERLFEITRVLALGWVRGPRDIEDDW